MGLTGKTTLLSLEKVGPWGPAIRVKHIGNTDEVLGAWGPRYFVGGTSNLVHVKTAADTWSEVSNVYLKTAVDTWSAVSQFCVKKDASTWDGTGDDMSGIDLVFPVFQSAATNTNGTKVILTYNKTLSATTAAASAFAVVVDGSSSTVSSVATSGATVELTMQTGIQIGETVTVAYTDPSGSDDANAIQDATGLDAISLSATSVTNNVAAPVFQSAATSTDGTKVILTYNQTLSATTAATSAFAVVVNSSAATISSAAVSGSTVELTLGTAVTVGQTATVAYTDPSGADDANAVQGTTGIDCASFTATSVTNAVITFVSSNLVFHLDPANTSCYSGSGTTVNSLVNNHTNDHFGDVTWSSDSGGNTGGYFEYDGTQNSGLTFPYSSDFEHENDGTNSVSDYSWEFWWYGEDHSPASPTILEPYITCLPEDGTGYWSQTELATQNIAGYMMYRLVTSTLKQIRIYRKTASPTMVYADHYGWNGSVWHHYVITKSGSTIKYYINNSLVETDTQTDTNNFSNTKKLFLGGRYDSSSTTYRGTIRLGVIRMYQGKALTATEVGNNYDAEKSRYT